MNPIWRTFWGLGLVVLPVGLVTLFAQTRPAPPAPFTSPPFSTECTTAPKTEYQRDVNGVTFEGQQVFFRGFSLISMNVCQPGELVIDAEPQLAGKEAPRLVMGLNNETLGERTIRQRETFRVPLKEAGKVTLGYFNDYYLSEARVITYEKFKFSGNSCSSLEVTASPETGGSYNPATNSANATWRVPIIVKPCSSGILNFLVIGRPADNIYPILKLSQAGQADRIIQTSNLRQAVQVRVSNAPLTLTLTNPYFKELADRNLILHSVQFVPRH